MNYQEMTDFEINKLVAKKLEGISFSLDGIPYQLYPSSCPSCTGCDYEEIEFSPCNSWIDAGLIIAEYFIQLEPEINSCCEECSDVYYTGKWEASYFDVDTRYTFTAISDNPLRAAMIVFLMMKEGGL